MDLSKGGGRVHVTLAATFAGQLAKAILVAAVVTMLIVTLTEPVWAAPGGGGGGRCNRDFSTCASGGGNGITRSGGGTVVKSDTEGQRVNQNGKDFRTRGFRSF